HVEQVLLSLIRDVVTRLDVRGDPEEELTGIESRERDRLTLFIVLGFGLTDARNMEQLTIREAVEPVDIAGSEELVFKELLELTTPNIGAHQVLSVSGRMGHLYLLFVEILALFHRILVQLLLHLRGQILVDVSPSDFV